MPRLTWWNHLIHIGIRCLDSVLNGVFFAHSLESTFVPRARIFFWQLPVCPYTGMNANEWIRSFSAMSLRISSIVRAPVTYLSWEFIWSLRATRMPQTHVYGESICSADTRLLSCLRSACKREYGLIALLRYKRTFTANLSCSITSLYFKRIFTTSTCSCLPLSKSIRSLHKHIFMEKLLTPVQTITKLIEQLMYRRNAKFCRRQKYFVALIYSRLITVLVHTRAAGNCLFVYSSLLE